VAATYDAIVLGVGGMGSAAVYHLARRGKRVLGLEQFDVPHAMGSSHGVNRIIRLAYWEHPSYVPLLFRAYELWRELELAFREQLLVITGGLDLGPEASETFRNSLLSCQLHHLRHEVIDSVEIGRRFPGYRMPDGQFAVFQPDGGFVYSERAIVAHVWVAMEKHGAEVRARERVVGWEPRGDGVEVRTDHGTYRAQRLIVTAGPWLAKALPRFAAVAVPERQVLAWFQPPRPELFQLGAFPVFNGEFPEGRYYGFPVAGIPGFKIGRYHHREERVDPETIDREPNAEDERVLRDVTARYFPDANGPTMTLKTCMFTNTPDEHFLIGSHPEEPSIVVAGGFSGHGYKFCSVIGEILADLVTEGETGHDLALFDPSRFDHVTA